MGKHGQPFSAKQPIWRPSGALGPQTLEDVKVAHSVDHDEEDQQDGAAGQSQPIIGDLDVLGRENRGAHFLS